jgi:HAD superfamily hydrolase (TIGR01490 family)
MARSRRDRPNSTPLSGAPPKQPRTKAAAFFDLDKTIIAKSSTLAFTKHFYAGGLINRRTMLKGAYTQFMFSVNGADHDHLQKMRAQLTDMVAGWDVEVVHQIVTETLTEAINPIVYAEAVELIEKHRAEGHDVVIVSASNSEIAEPVGAMLGVDHVIATTLEVEDGKYTGNLTFFAYGPHKAEAITALAEREGYDLAASFAYSDGETDLPLLQAVGHPFAVNPDKGLRQQATELGWPILSFERTTRLSGLSNPKTRTAAMAGLIGSASLIALAVAARHRSSHA